MAKKTRGRPSASDCANGNHTYGPEQVDNSWTYFIRYTEKCKYCPHVKVTDVRRP